RRVAEGGLRLRLARITFGEVLVVARGLFVEGELLVAGADPVDRPPGERVREMRLDESVPGPYRLPDQMGVLKALARVPEPLGVLGVRRQHVGGGEERPAAFFGVAPLLVVMSFAVEAVTQQ